LSKLSILDWLAVSGGTVCAQFRGDIVVMQKQRMMAGREIIPNAPIEEQAPALLKWTEYMPSLFVGYELLKRFENE
jgi:hypothetical protein